MSSHGSNKGQEKGQYLTETEKDMLIMLKKGWTPEQISNRRGTSESITYRFIRQLKKKGLWNPKVQRSEPQRGHSPRSGFITSKGIKNAKRLHGQQFVIEIIHKGRHYEQIRKKKGTRYKLDKNQIVLNNNNIEIYADKDISFFGETARQAVSNSIDYWDNLLIKIENDLDLLLVKDRRLNWKEVKLHIAELDNELAKDAYKKKQKIRVKATEDGKTWLVCDFSRKRHEAETQHPETAVHDMDEVVAPFFNDLRDNDDIPLPSDAWRLQAETMKYVKEIGAGLSVLVKYWESQIPKEESVDEDKKNIKPSYLG